MSFLKFSKALFSFGIFKVHPGVISSRMMSSTTESAPEYNFETFLVKKPSEYVYHVEINRPAQMNAMNNTFWRETTKCFNQLHEDPDCRAIVLSGAGKVFSAGLDFSDMAKFSEVLARDDDIARKAKFMRELITSYQESFTSIEKCNKPVIAAVHSACVGGAVNMVSACDIRYCTSDAWFQIKEVDIGIAADVGALQRLPKYVGNNSLVRELVFSARKMNAGEALQLGLVSKVLPTQEDLMMSAFEMASLIASKSPVAVQGSKVHMNYSRDHTVEEGLAYMANWNMTMLLSEDVMKAAMSAATKSKEMPVFAKY